MVDKSDMPHIPFVNSVATENDMQDTAIQIPADDSPKRRIPIFGRVSRLGHWFRDNDTTPKDLPLEDDEPQEEATRDPEKQQEQQQQQQQEQRQPEEPPTRRPSLLGRKGHRRAVPGLPRPLTFRRQNSEKRDRLLAVEPTLNEKRALSADRRPRSTNRTDRASSPKRHLPSLSAPEVGTPIRRSSSSSLQKSHYGLDDIEGSIASDPVIHAQSNLVDSSEYPPVLDDESHSDVLDERELQAELESQWILNLSMHFRDKSEREKFFVTYAQRPNLWRRVTISLDYRDAEPESLEADLKTLRYQRDKNARIYEAVRDSLADIQFFDTVTNLKLQTEDGRLHVHVTEDVNEIISYPSISLVEHVHCKRYRESELTFDAHLSGFVYRVSVNDQDLIKKEIPGPDTVDEFLYEINALDSLQDARSVIQFHGLVIDEGYAYVKGLLISYAPRGSLVDMLYDYKDTDQLPWERRERWAYQTIEGLSEIHEAGFVQGDFTLSNIVIDSDDDAKIIDINRRGCPVGWEPPELLSLIHSGQRISMCIGVKSDLFQLGMVLWALAEKTDEPESAERTNDRLPPVRDQETPLWFKRIVEICLSERPKDRLSAKQLLGEFPPIPEPEDPQAVDLRLSDHSIRSRRSDKQYIDPAAAVHLEDIEEHRRNYVPPMPSHLTSEAYTSADPAPSTYDRFQSDGSYLITNHGATAGRGRRKPSSSATSLSATDAVGFTTKIDVRQDMHDEVVDLQEHLSRQHKLIRESSVARLGEFQSSQESYPHATGERGSLREHDTQIMHNTNASSQISEYGLDDGNHSSERRESAYFSSPLHHDSGFDEDMIAGIESSNATRFARSSTSQQDEAEDRNPECGQLIRVTALPPDRDPPTEPPQKCDVVSPQSAPEIPTRTSYHTPLARPLTEKTTAAPPAQQEPNLKNEASQTPEADDAHISTEI